MILLARKVHEARSISQCSCFMMMKRESRIFSVASSEIGKESITIAPQASLMKWQRPTVRRSFEFANVGGKSEEVIGF